MKPLRLLISLSLALGTLLSANAMNNADVIKMKQSGLSDSTILLSMDKQSAEYDTSANELVKLKEANVSEPIIQKMLALGSGAPTTGAAPVPVTPPPAGAVPGIPVWPETPSLAPPTVEPVAGQNYFLRFTIMIEKNTYNTTNYARGDVVPINTEVQVVSLSSKAGVLKRVDNGETIKIDNKQEYTKKTVPEFLKLMLASEKTAVEKLPPSLATAVTTGQMRLGMTKEQVLMARGFPPAHKTPSIEGDRWVYWQNRFAEQTVVFTDGRLTQGRGIN